MRRPSPSRLPGLVLVTVLAGALAGCGIVGGAASVAGTAVSVAATAAGTAVDVVTSPIR